MEWRKRFLASLTLCLFFGWLSFGGCFYNDCLALTSENIAILALGILASIPLCLNISSHLSHPYSPAPRNRILRTSISTIVVIIVIAIIIGISPIVQEIVSIASIAVI